MDCEWRSKLDPYVDAELPDTVAAEMQAHVLTCPSCAAEALTRSQMKRAVRTAAVDTFSPSPQFRLKLEAAIRKPRRHWFSSILGAPRLPRSTQWSGIGWGFAAALAVILVTFLLYRAPRPNVAGELADLHVATLASANPVDVVSTDRHTVKPWFAGKLPFTFNLPELGNTPYRLVGGRLTYLNQSPGAQLLFTIRSHQLSVFVFQDRNGLERLGSNLSDKRNLQFNLETWAAGGLRYFIISDANPDDIRTLADLLKSAS